MKVSDVHLFSSWWIIDQFHSISPWLSMLPLPWLCAPHHCFRATGLHPHLYPRHKEELKELSKSENSIKYPCWCHLQWQRQLAQVSQTLNTASSGWFTFTNISGTKLINITLIQKFNIHRKYLQVQRDSQKKKKKNFPKPNSLFSNLSHLYAALTKGHESWTKVILN